MLSSYLDDRLDGASRATVDEHLASCADCARELSVLRRVSSALAGDDGVPPTGLAARVARGALAAADAADAADIEPSFLDRWIRIAWPTAAAGALAAIALLLTIGTGTAEAVVAGDPIVEVAAGPDLSGEVVDVLALEEE
jgi:anti-sigma factor RsiW